MIRHAAVLVWEPETRRLAVVCPLCGALLVSGSERVADVLWESMKVINQRRKGGGPGGDVCGGVASDHR